MVCLMIVTDPTEDPQSKKKTRRTSLLSATFASQKLQLRGNRQSEAHTRQNL